MAKNRKGINAEMKKTVEELNSKEIVSIMLKNKWVNWKPLAILVFLRNTKQELYPKNLILNDGTLISVTEENCLRKIDNICFSLAREGIFWDSTETEREKIPAIKIVWVDDLQNFITSTAVFKDTESAAKFLKTYFKILQPFDVKEEDGILQWDMLKGTLNDEVIYLKTDTVCQCHLFT